MLELSFTEDVLSQDFKNKTEELKLFWLPEHLRSGGAGLPAAGNGESLSLSQVGGQGHVFN